MISGSFGRVQRRLSEKWLNDASAQSVSGRSKLHDCGAGQDSQIVKQISNCSSRLRQRSALGSGKVSSGLVTGYAEFMESFVEFRKSNVDPIKRKAEVGGGVIVRCVGVVLR